MSIGMTAIAQKAKPAAKKEKPVKIAMDSSSVKIPKITLHQIESLEKQIKVLSNPESVKDEVDKMKAIEIAKIQSVIETAADERGIELDSLSSWYIKDGTIVIKFPKKK